MCYATQPKCVTSDCRVQNALKLGMHAYITVD